MKGSKLADPHGLLGDYSDEEEEEYEDYGDDDAEEIANVGLPHSLRLRRRRAPSCMTRSCQGATATQEPRRPKRRRLNEIRQVARAAVPLGRQRGKHLRCI